MLVFLANSVRRIVPHILPSPRLVVPRTVDLYLGRRCQDDHREQAGRGRCRTSERRQGSEGGLDGRGGEVCEGQGLFVSW